MIKKLLPILTISAGLLATNGCTNINLNSLPAKSDKTIKTSKSDDISMGTVVIDLSALSGKSTGFNTKATFTDPNIAQIKIDITGYDMAPVSKTVNWVRNTVLTVPMTVPSGKNRLISIAGLSNIGKPVAKIMGISHVYRNTLTPVLISYGTTTAARVLNNILNGDHPEVADKIEPDKLKALLYNITGYDDSDNSYKILNPIVIDANAISDKIIASNGEIDPQNLGDIGNVALPVKVKVFVKNKNGTSINSNVLVSANDISCNNPVNNKDYYSITVDQGTWEISAKLYMNAAGTTIIIPTSNEEVRKLILNGGRVLYASKMITIKGTEAEDVTLNLADLEVIL